MLQKAFQIALVTFVVILTAAGAVLLISGAASFLLPSTGTGMFVYSGGVSLRTLKRVAVVLIFLTIAVVFRIARRSKLR